ncbi:solute carrier family 22 member 6-B [Caerostris darwini]|uniref:Solute carrier family 22 member 6-B n=1 Tax=Caerostris darwini TaxID=1538125 RepID=A0AAV4PS58_9ARAC|nr:solute carrier family 22 member 6-B [Caerostris darwini]
MTDSRQSPVLKMLSQPAVTSSIRLFYYSSPSTWLFYHYFPSIRVFCILVLAPVCNSLLLTASGCSALLLPAPGCSAFDVPAPDSSAILFPTSEYYAILVSAPVCSAILLPAPVCSAILLPAPGCSAFLFQHQTIQKLFSQTSGFGKRVLFFSALLLQSASGVATAFSPNLICFAVFRCLAGMALPGVLIAPATLAHELTGWKQHSKVSLLCSAARSIGMVLLAGIVLFVGEWSNLALASSIPFYAFFLYSW